MAPFFRAGAMRIVEPDLGRCGITEALAHRARRRTRRHGDRAASRARPRPLFFATLQFRRRHANCRMVPHTPGLVETAGEYSTSPVAFRNGHYTVPTAPGLGIELAEPEVRLVEVA